MHTSDIEKETEIKWTKQGTNVRISFLGRDILVFSSVAYITFVETSRPEKKEITYHANCEIRGDGVKTLCTHRFLHCFAFAEMCRNPRILIVNYPNFDVFKTFESVTDTSYEALRFSEMEFLVALTGTPDFKLVVWNWRTGEKVYTKESDLRLSGQILRVSLTSPIFMIQTNPRHPIVNLWAMNLCFKSTVFKKNKIKLPEKSCPPYYFTFGGDSDLYFVDGSGSLYAINPETLAITLHFPSMAEAQPSFFPCVTWFRGGIVYSTPTEIFSYKRKSPEGWQKVWSFTPKTPFRNILSSALKDYLVGTTIANEILMFKGETQIELSPVKHFGSDFDFFGLINPLGDHFITYGNSVKKFVVWNKSNGHKVSEFLWNKGIVKKLACNPRLPYLVVTTTTGGVYIINAYDPNNLLEIDEVFLTDSSLDSIRFRHLGVQFCVANMDVGEFFLLRLPMKLDVVAHLRVDLKIVDFGLVDKDPMVYLLVVPMSQLCCRSGQSVCIYVLSEKDKTFDIIKDVTLPTVVTEICPPPTSLNNLICVPHRSRKIYFFNLTNGKVVSEIISGHQTKFISVLSDNRYILTHGTDGLVIIKTFDTKKCVTVFSTHHRLAGGIRKIDIDPNILYVIALGENGCLVVTHLKKMLGPNRRQEMEQIMHSAQCQQLLHHPYFAEKKSKTKKSETLDPSEHMSSTKSVSSGFLSKHKKFWLKMREKEKASNEEQMYKKKKQAIWDEFLIIKTQLKQLLDENEAHVPEKKLPIQAFDLDKVGRRKKLEDAKVDRERERQYQLAKMKCLNKISDIIKKTCWDSMTVKGQEVQGILAPVSVQSYALLPTDQHLKTIMLWLGEALKIKKLYLKADFFDPWIPKTESQILEQINKKFEMAFIDVTQTIKTKFEEQQAEEEKVKIDVEEQMSQYVWSGTSSHNFIEVESLHFSQFEICTYAQSEAEIWLIESDIRKLMEWFNKQFLETFEVKERDMATIIDRNNRLRHIINELNFFNFSSNICNTTIIDPEWAPEENPQTILTVQDHEVNAPQYISDSRMELSRKQKLEDEKLQQMLLLSDFKEKALMNMMDGVLEKLWEDEIKKEPQKPKCMTEKKPETYNEEDLKAISAYEESLRFLVTERERYRKILEAEWAKTTLVVKENAARFDEKVTKLHVLKLKVEAAIQQEILKCLRIREDCYQRIAIDRKIGEISMEITRNEDETEMLTAECSKLMESLNDCRNYYENLQIKDKNLDKNFKKEFVEYSPMVTEQLYKLRKKRPKLQQRAAAFSTILTDMGKCAVTGAKPEYMPIECIQYLKDIDALDAPSNMPASVTPQSWETACKLRRAKIDIELKLRACTIDLAEAETTVANCNKTLKATKDRHAQLVIEQQELKAKKLHFDLDKKIQIVLKKGLVEIPLTGQISDFQECILVAKNTLNDVNGLIQKMGHQKIKAMKKATNFRKGIIYKEWEHKKFRMEIEDLRSRLETVTKFQVLKEVQALLTGRARGLQDEKGFLYMENALSNVREKFYKSEIDIHNKVDELNIKIEKVISENRHLDEKIVELNVEVNELNLSRDLDFEKKNTAEYMKRMKKVRERSAIMRQIQEQHNEILVLQTELELLRLRTYPVIKQRIS